MLLTDPNHFLNSTLIPSISIIVASQSLIFDLKASTSSNFSSSDEGILISGVEINVGRVSKDSPYCFYQ